ncbi:hypothetical protein BN12_2200009 [Nostocoides japonicum T1-X7]|uniref:Integrase family protein n=1 Tax=Nostocoides japonicum T1-X7 TaxID=1194083 RepID=A0A077LV20_9MICO|nr:site-specific integrase [Tetrasphaera japonica]CCH77768.1 hypothetical protein BN12_2200009 [Tetrasphaera japonica T1-X7]
MTSDARIPPPDCPPWCTSDHTEELNPSDTLEFGGAYFHRSLVAQIPAQGDGPGEADLIRVELQSDQWINSLTDDLADLTPAERVDRAEAHRHPTLWLVLAHANEQAHGGITYDAQVHITLAQLVRLADDLRAATTTPAVARLALADASSTLEPDPARDPTAGPTTDPVDAGDPASGTPAHPTLEDWRRRGIADDYAAATLRSREAAVRLISRHAGVAPHELTQAHVIDYLAAHPEQARWTRLKYLQHLRAWAAFAGIPDPTLDVRRPTTPKGRPRPINDAELGRLLAVATGRSRLFVMFGAYAGLRSFETAKVELEDLEDAGEGTWRLRVTGKGGRVDTIPCHPALAAAVREYAEAAGIAQGRMFPGVTADVVQWAIKRLASKAGIRCSSHQLRHWYGTAAHRASGGDLLVTQRLMRHSNPATTAGYADVSGTRIRDVVDGLAPWLTAGEQGRPGLRLIRGGPDETTPAT